MLHNLKMSVWPDDIISKQDLQLILSWGNTWDEDEKSQPRPECPARPQQDQAPSKLHSP